MKECRKRLATVWLVGSGILFLVVLLQSLFGRYGDKADEAWGWFLPTILPTLSLMIAVLIADALDKSSEVKFIDTFMYKVTVTLSIAYIVTVSLTIFLSPFSNWTQLQLLKLSHLWLGPFQGIVSGAIGLFFVSKEFKDTKS